ncbi:MAG: riboflavin synthase subunit alpha [Opitutales bacterium]|nr:riboflavin synthase subunit alpha [Opitutales bacterium]
MFTGIVQGIATITSLSVRPGLNTIGLVLPDGYRGNLRYGASVSVDGVCLTVAAIEGDEVRFDVMQETLSQTTLGSLVCGARVNIERSAKAGDEIGGHAVSGHVDTVAEIVDIRKPENNTVIRFKVPGQWMHYVFSKGFLSINGCSLTVVNADRSSCTLEVWLIPETLRLTTFGEKNPGDRVNIEIDRQTQAIVDTVKTLLSDPEFLKAHSGT